MFAILQTDRAIIRSVLQGRTDRFGLLVDRYGRLAYAVAYAYLRNPHDAEDVVQESFTRLYERLDTLSWKQNIGPWLAQVARNTAVDRLRKRGREALLTSQPPESVAHLPNPARDEMRRLVSDELQHLDPAEREVLLLHYFLGKKAREIALLLDIQPEAAAKRLQRARDELGRRLVDVLKEDLAEDSAEPARRRRVMAAISATAIPWKPSAAAAVAASVATGVSATKVTLGIACPAILLAAIIVGGGRYMSRPYSTKDITAASSFKFEPVATKPSTGSASGASAAAGDKNDTQPAASTTEKSSAASAVSTGLRVYGLLLSEDRQPISGATVVIDNSQIVESRRQNREAGGEAPEVDEVKLTAISDQQGRFDIESVPYNPVRGFYGFRLWSRHAGLAACERLDVTPTSTERYYELVMMPEGALTGLVTDMQGVPINRAYVGLRGARCRKDLNALPVDRAYTGKDGRFTFEFLPSGSYRMEIDARGFAPLDTPWITAGDPNLVFQLDTGDSISGRVVEDATGKPLPHVGVFARQRADFNYRVADAETDAGGQFTITGLIPATFIISLISTPHTKDVPYTLPEQVSVTVQAGQPVTGVELRAVMGASVSGRVVEADSGQPPQALAWVQAKGSGATPWERGVRVEKDGSYIMCGLPPGEFVLNAGYVEMPSAETKKTVKIHGSEPVTGVDFSLAKLDKSAAKDQVLTGKVLDPSGAAVEGANVVAVSVDSRGEDASALTDAEGEFVISFNYNREPGDVYVQAFAQNAMSRRAGPIAAIGGSCTLRLEPAGRIEGAVVDAAGEPVVGAAVAAIGDDAAGSILRNDAPWRALREIHGTKAGTSETGAFVMPSVTAGSYRIEVYVPAATIDLPVAKGHVQVRAGETLRTRLVIDTKELGTIEGTITMNGAPVPDTHVTAMWVDAAWLNTVQDYSDSSGHYVLPHIQPGKAKVIAEVMPSGQTTADLVQHAQLVDVDAGRTATADFTLNSEKTGAAEGYVYVNGVPAEYIEVEFKAANADEEDAANTKARTNREGWFRVEGLAEGAYVGEARQFIPYGMGDRFRLSDAQEASIKTEETVRLDFHLNAGRIEGTISGIQKGRQAIVSLLDGSFNPFSLTPQALLGMEEKVLTAMPLPHDGPFTIENVPGGNYVFGAVSVPSDASQWDMAPAFAAIAAGKYTAAQIQVVAAQTTTIDLTLP